MRLWHQLLIPLLPRQQLLGQHRECAALRGLGWGRKHATVDYVFEHSPAKLFAYHRLVMAEMEQRGYRVDCRWLNPAYRGLRCPAWPDVPTQPPDLLSTDEIIYTEHDPDYLQECLHNLQYKGVLITDESVGAGSCEIANGTAIPEEC